jgi:hypothetical protein
MSSKLHLIEIDHVIYFPSTGNVGRTLNKYGVAYRDRKNKTSQPGKKIYLEDVLALQIINAGYPHTVGFFTTASGKGRTYTPDYKELRKISNETALIQWIEDLNL